MLLLCELSFLCSADDSRAILTFGVMYGTIHSVKFTITTTSGHCTKETTNGSNLVSSNGDSAYDVFGELVENEINTKYVGKGLSTKY